MSVRRLILWDIDGILVDAHRVSAYAFFKCLSSVFGKDMNFDNTSGVTFAGQTDCGIAKGILQAHKFPTESWTERKSEFFEQLPDFFRGEYNLYGTESVKRLEGPMDVLAQWGEQHGVVHALLTGNHPVTANLKITYAGYDSTNFDFDVSSWGSLSECRSDLPEFALREFRKKFGVDSITPDRCLIVGDTPNDVKCAQDNGMRSLAVATGRFSVQQLRNCAPDFVLPNLQDSDSVARILESL
eukprot:Rmarinus@m.27663